MVVTTTHVLITGGLLLLTRMWIDVVVILQQRHYTHMCMQLVREGVRLVETAVASQQALKADRRANEREGSTRPLGEFGRQGEHIRSCGADKQELRDLGAQRQPANIGL